jgi:hypothetical protein
MPAERLAPESTTLTSEPASARAIAPNLVSGH